MNVDLDGPADTRLMGIVHTAMRRDLARARSALTASDPPESEQRIAIGEHLGWMMHFLHLHHESEDVGLYPLVRARNTAAGALLDEMDDDHQRIVPAMERVTAAAAAYAASADGQQEMIDSIDALEMVLLPHLAREESDMMPVVAASITEREWRAWDQKYNVSPLPKRELAMTGLWIMDGQPPDDQRAVAELVPRVPRWFILTFVSRIHRRAAFRRWRAAEHSDRRVGCDGRVTIKTAASPEAVWAVLTDVTRVGEWSHECQTARWIGGASRARVGAQFRGRNRAGAMRWSRPCEVTEFDPPRTFAFRTDGGWYGDRTLWRFRLEPDADGITCLTQSRVVLNMSYLMDRFVSLTIPTHRDRDAALLADLERLCVIAEREAGMLPLIA